MWFYGYTQKSKLLLLVIDINTVEKVSFFNNVVLQFTKKQLPDQM